METYSKYMLGGGLMIIGGPLLILLSYIMGLTTEEQTEPGFIYLVAALYFWMGIGLIIAGIILFVIGYRDKIQYKKINSILFSG